MKQRLPTLRDILLDPALAGRLGPEDVAVRLQEVAALQSLLTARFLALAEQRKEKDEDRPLGVEEAAEYGRCSPWCVMAAARAGKIPGASKPGKRWRFTRSGLDAWIRSRSRGAA